MTYTFHRREQRIYIYEEFSYEAQLTLMWGVVHEGCDTLLEKRIVRGSSLEAMHYKLLTCPCCAFFIETYEADITLEDLSEQAMQQGCKRQYLGVH